MRVLTLLLAGLLSVSPVLAQENNPDPAAPTCPEGEVETPEGCSKQAWIDCPPDQFCIASDPDQPTYGDCGAEVCAYGNESCIECSGPVGNSTDTTCMDGTQGQEVCRDDVMYVGGPTRGPEDESCENCRGEDAEGADEAESANTPGAGVLAILGATAFVAIVIRMKRKP